MTSNAISPQGKTGDVLVLGTDCRVVLAVARSLGRHGVRVHLGWSASESIANRSRYVERVHELPPYDPDNDTWKRALKSLLRNRPFDLVIPCNDSTTVPLHHHRDDFAEFPQIYLPPAEAFEIAFDKIKTHELARSVEVAVPRGQTIYSAREVDELLAGFEPPFVLKPRATVTPETRGASNVVQKVNTLAEVRELVDSPSFAGGLMVQENFWGKGAGVEVIVHEGDVKMAFQHARIHETTSWGSSYRKSVPLDAELLDATRKLMKALNYTGVAMAEFIVNPHTGDWVFLEINGRFWGSLPLAVASGAHFPYYLYQMLVEGKTDFPQDYTFDVRCRNLILDMQGREQWLPSGRWAKAMALMRTVPKILFRDRLDSFAVDDMKPGLVELMQLGRRCCSKAWCKLWLVGRRNVDARSTEAASAAPESQGRPPVAVGAASDDETNDGEPVSLGAPPGIEVSRVASLSELAELRDPWNRLAGDVPFRRWEWVTTWWEHYGDAGELFVLCVRDEQGRLLGAAPWYLEHSGLKGRVVQFLGSGEICSDHQTLLCRDEDREQVVRAVAQWLGDVQPTFGQRVFGGGANQWDLLLLDGVDADDRAVRQLVGQLEQQRCSVYEEPGPGAWRLTLPDDWDAYLAMLSKSHRKQVRRCQRRVLEAGRAVLHTVRRADDLSHAFDTLVELHQRRWEACGEKGCFASPRFMAFHREIAQKLLEQGMLRLHWLELDGRPAAAEYHFAAGDTVYAYQSGVEPDLRDEEPGRFAAVATLEQAIDDGYRHVDFLRGDEPYKAHWRAEPQPTAVIRVVARNATAQFRDGVWRAARSVKRRLSDEPADETPAGRPVAS